MKLYSYPHDINERDLRRRADRRRAALIAHSCATYELGWRDGDQRILCLCCGLGTTNSHDIREKFCGFCRHFHNEGIEQSETEIELREGLN